MKIIALKTTILDGIGDWVHYLEVARFIRQWLNRTGHQDIQLVGVVWGTNKHQIHQFAKSSERNQVFKHLLLDQEWKQGEPPVAFVCNEILDAPDNELLCTFVVPTYDIPSLRSQREQEGLFVSMSEFSCYEIPRPRLLNLPFGIGYLAKEAHDESDVIPRAEGLRISPFHLQRHFLSAEQYRQTQVNFWQSLFDRAPGFASKLIGDKSNVAEFIQSRVFLPADLRCPPYVLLFVSTYLAIYGSRCDFYLPDKYLQNIEIRNEINRLTKQTAQFIDASTQKPVPAGGPRFFSGFPLDDQTYKGLYRFNGGVGAGSAGDDTFNETICSGNVPFHEAANGMQAQFLNGNIIPLLKQLNFKALAEFYTTLYADTDRWAMLPNLEHYPEQMLRSTGWYKFLKQHECGFASKLPKKLAALLNSKSLKQEFSVFKHFIFQHYNIYEGLEKILGIIIGGKARTASNTQILKQCRKYLGKRHQVREQAMKVLAKQNVEGRLLKIRCKGR